MESLKIAFLTDMCSPLFGGGYQNRHWNLALHLQRRGHSVVVYTAERDRCTVREGVRFSRVAPLSFLPDLTGSRTLPFSGMYVVAMARPPIWFEPPDILITEAIPYLHLPIMSRWARQLKATKVLNVNEAWAQYSYFPGPLSAPSRSIVRWCLDDGLKSSDLAMGISKVTGRSLREQYGYARVAVIPMGLDVAEFLGSLSATTSKEPYDVVTTGRLVEIKRQSDLLEALSILRERHDWKGRAGIVGGGKLRDDLEARCHRLGLRNQVDFLNPPFGTRNLLPILRGAKAFALCSEREGFSVATLEAALAGVVPVVAKPIHWENFGVSDFVRDGVEGLHYPVRDVAALADALWRVISMEDLRRQLSSRAQETARRYDWSEITQDLESLLRDPESYLERTRSNPP